MNIRERVQSEASSAIKSNKFNGIVHVSPRVGKSKIVLDALNSLNLQRTLNVLITAPLKPILTSWKQEIKKWGIHKNIKLEYVWDNSIKKHTESYDLIIADEIHDYSESVLTHLLAYKNVGTRILGLTGTMSKSEESLITKILDLPILYEYSFAQAIEDGIIADYHIYCHSVELDSESNCVMLNIGGKPFLTSEYNAYAYWDDKYKEVVEKKKYHLLNKFASGRLNIIYNSIAKIEKTQSLIEQMNRCLIFTGRTEVADQIGDCSYHGKSVKSALDTFVKKDKNKLSVVSMVSMGITIPELKHVVFNQLKSSESLCVQQALRAMNLEDKKSAEIHIVYLKNTQDQVWVENAIKSFDKNKITWL